MLRRLVPATLACAALLTLAACGSDGGEVAVDRAATTTGSSPATPQSTPASDPGSDPASDPGLPPPMWPATGCSSRSVVSVDYGRLPTGYGSPLEAVEHAPADVPHGDLRLAPAQDKGPGVVWVVDPQSGDLLAQVTVFQGPGGWVVDGVTTCA